VSRRNLNSQKVIKTINDCGGIAIPAHPFRNSHYGRALTKREINSDEISIIEELNGSNSGEQNKKATALIERTNLRGIGGSDAHSAKYVGFGITYIDAEPTISSILSAIRTGNTIAGCRMTPLPNIHETINSQHFKES
jgi:predicted metal-dependent phosphoesterase TrpH